MARSQRHRLQLNGVVSDDIKGQTPSCGTYKGSNLRAGAVVGAATRGRTGGALSNDGVGGPGTQDIGGYVGLAVGAAAIGHVDGFTGPRDAPGLLPFSPRDLFGPADNGAWLDPSATGFLYRTTGMMLNARYNGPIKAIADKSGKGRDAVQATTSLAPLFANDVTTGKTCVRFKQGFDLLPIAFGATLGANCTIVFANGSSVEFLTGQSVGATYTITKTFFQFLIINRALTAAEKTSLTNYFSVFCPKYTPTYSCYADPTRPDDSGNGLAPNTAKKTLLAATNILWTLPSGATLGLMPGTYSGEQITTNLVSNLAGKTHGIHAMAAGVVIDGGEPPPHPPGVLSAFDCAATDHILEIWGNGNLSIQNYGNNGVGCSASGHGRAMDCRISGCDDGLTIHATSAVEDIRNTVSGCTKGAFTHTGNGANAKAEFSAFYGRLGALAGVGLFAENGGTFDFFGCDFLPDPATTTVWSSYYVASTDGSPGSSTPTAAQRRIRGCRFGAPHITIGATGQGIGGLHNTTIEDCYLNGFLFQTSVSNLLVQWTRCYGGWGYRPRRTTTSLAQWDNCVNNLGSVTTHVAVDAFFYSAPSDVFGSGYVKNCIFTGCATAIKAVSNVAEFNAQFQLLNNLFYNNTLNYTAGITPDGVDVVGQNPLIIDMTSTEQADWHVQAGSPSLGAGVGGSDIGLGL